MTEFLAALIAAALINNLVLGLPLAADGLRQTGAQRFGAASAMLILLACPLAWLLVQPLQQLALQHLALLLGLPLLAGLALLLQRLLGTASTLWPLLLGNGLGAMLLAMRLDSLAAALALGIGGGLGFWLALQLLDDLFLRIDQRHVAPAFRGAPVRLIASGLASLAFLGLTGVGQ